MSLSSRTLLLLCSFLLALTCFSGAVYAAGDEVIPAVEAGAVTETDVAVDAEIPVAEAPVVEEPPAEAADIVATPSAEADLAATEAASAAVTDLDAGLFTADTTSAALFAAPAGWTQVYSPYTGKNYWVPRQPTALGIDVSHWQGGAIDWAKVAASGVRFAIIRVGHRRSGAGTLGEDRYYRRNIEEALANGIRVGVYIYSQAYTAAMAREEAKYVLDRIGGYRIDLGVCIDYEFDDGRTGILAQAYANGTLNKERGTDVCLAFCDVVRAQGYRPIVYGNFSMFRDYLNKDRIAANAMVWMARVNTAPEHLGVYMDDMDYWQYSFSGAIPGIPGNVDCNFAFVDDNFDPLDPYVPFYDVKAKNWFYDAVRYCYEQELLAGVSATRFAPATTMSRAMLVTALYRLEGSPAVSGSNSFTDLKADWYRSAVQWAYANDIVVGVAADKFAPAADVTREQIALIFHRYAEHKKYDVSQSAELTAFSDAASISAQAENAVKWAVGAGYLSGFDDKTMRPKANATRAQVAAILYRFVKIGDFEDVAPSAWYYSAVRRCQEKRLFGGVSDKKFAADETMSRAMLVTVLYRMDGTPAADGATPYTDLTQDWYRPAVQWAYANHIADGATETTFEPNAAASREQVASMLYRYAVYKGYDTTAVTELGTFSDADTVSATAIEAMKWAVAVGHLSGFPDNTLRPQASTSRAQVATILLRFLDSLAE